MPDLQEDFWDNLLDYIDDRKVIPVIGPELVTVREDDGDVPLYRWIAQRLAGDLKLPIAELPEGFDLNDVVSMHQTQRLGQWRGLQPGRKAAGHGERGQDRDPVGCRQPQTAGHAGGAQRPGQ